jgi:hypothetical protein
MRTLAEEIDVVAGVAPQDIGTADVTGTYILVSNYKTLLATLITASLTAGKVATIELLQATSSAGAGAKALKAAVTATAPTGNGVVRAEVGVTMDELDTDNGFIYVAAKVTCNEDAKVGAVTVALGGKRYSA